MDRLQSADRAVSRRVVLFSGGRGSELFSSHLLKDPLVQLTLAINGYDDGRSTGEVRRLLGDSLGPSDFRKNAGRLARELGSCDPLLVRTLEERLPGDISPPDALAALRQRTAVVPELREDVEAFLSEWRRRSTGFAFGDCSIGNIVFGGGFLRIGRQFNRAVDRYCARLGLPAGTIDNVTCGENAYLVGIAGDGTVLASEADVVAGPPRPIRDIFLIEHRLGPADLDRLRRLSVESRAEFLAERQIQPRLNPRLAARLAEADLIVYAPGTQHSSLYPSYLTAGLPDVIAGNLTAVKLLVTNIKPDVEIDGASAVDLIRGALRYLTARTGRAIPTPCLITHYMVNDPQRQHAGGRYVPPGRIDTLEDARLVRIGNFEEGVSGRHDAAKLLGPVVSSLFAAPARTRVGVVLEHASSVNTVAQTLLEMVRGGVARLPLDVTVLHEGPSLDGGFVSLLPFSTQSFGARGDLADALTALQSDYIILFDSSGMYRGEDLVALASHLADHRLDGVWGSRRLSLRDIDESIRWRYRKSPLMGVVSRLGSEVLSLTCLLRYGRYVSDTLSGVRAFRTSELQALPLALAHPLANQYLLAALLRRKAELLEVPVQFLPLSPERVRRTTVADGLRALWTLLSGRTPASALPTSRHPDLRTQSGQELTAMTGAASAPVLVVAAAGLGSRLNAGRPKFLVPVGGRPMIDWVLDLHRHHVSRVVLVVAPAAVAEAERQFGERRDPPVDLVIQDCPTGMLDAVLLAAPAVAASGAARVWVTWCDQIAIDPRTVRRMADEQYSDTALTLPVVRRREPYIHFDRDDNGRIRGVRQRREGDVMPAVGETDAGLFNFSRAAFLDALPEYAAVAPSGIRTTERSLLPFIPWLAARAEVATIPCVDEMEALGVNTPEELATVERYLAARAPV
jgi:CTP:molybdopterin cytidylyltransferase MocA/2-phospho-L-lactate transferase/gluconeogenesis factor (CofD/UPF0052 family)